MTEHVNMYTPALKLLRILTAPQDYISILVTGFTFITLLTHEIFSISVICIFHSSRRALFVQLQFVDLFYNPRCRINNSILSTQPHLQMAFNLTVF